jgi:short-subunit dehydrogenase
VLDEYRTALVTGASRGIGEAFARQLAARGLDLILVARSEDRLEALAGELSERHGVTAHVVVADLARPSAAETVFAVTERLGVEVDLLVNNAGFAKAGDFSDLPLDVQADMVRLNVNTLVELARLYLPAMRRRERGGVINVSSTAAFQPVPDMAVYSATKAFVLDFSLAVAAEVAGDGVRVMALCPGATGTDFWAIAGVWAERTGRMPTADEVVAAGLRAFERGRWFFVPGFFNQVVAFFSSRVLPRRLVVRLAQRWL